MPHFISKRCDVSNQQQVLSKGATLAVEVLGDGAPVVFLHAAVTDRRMWHAEMKGVAASRQAISYDRRGFGDTIAGNDDYSSLVDLLAVLDATSNGEPAVLVGCSQGGRIAIDAALTHPERVCGLVLIAPNITGEPTPNHSTEIANLLSEQKEADAFGEVDRISQIKARLWLDGPLAPENRVSGSGRHLFREMHTKTLSTPNIGCDLDTGKNYHRLGEIDVPTLIVWGNLDFPHIQDRCRYLGTAIPNALTYKMRDTAHLPSLEKADEVTQQLVSFLGRPEFTC